MTIFDRNAFALVAVVAGQPPSHTYNNVDYGFTISVPVGFQVCTALSGKHPHGFYTYLDGHHCTSGDRAESVTRSVEVWADYNTAGFHSASELLKRQCDRRSRGPAPIMARSKSVSCTLRDGKKVSVIIISERGKCRDDAADPDRYTPCIFYTATLETNSRHLEEDTKFLNRVVSSLRTIAYR
jgi:hypothetical protein